MSFDILAFFVKFFLQLLFVFQVLLQTFIDLKNTYGDLVRFCDI